MCVGIMLILLSVVSVLTEYKYNNTHTSKQRVYVYHRLSVVVSATTYYRTTRSPTHSDRDRLCVACVCDICGATLVVG